MVGKDSEKIHKKMTLGSQLPDKLPESISLEVTTRCNYQCPYCYCFWHEFPDKTPRLLDTEEWKRLITQCIQKGGKEFTFTGGEALLRPDICELLDYASRQNKTIRISLFTNGSRMDDKMFHFCMERKIAISTSLQGLRSHRAMTGTQYGYRKTLELIALGHQEHWPISVSVTVTKGNRDEIRDIFAAAALCGASSIQLGPMMPEGRGKFHLDLALNEEEWEQLKREIRDMRDCGVPYVFCDEIVCRCKNISPEILRMFPAKSAAECRAGKDFGVIGPDGKYRKCLHYFPAEY